MVAEQKNDDKQDIRVIFLDVDGVLNAQCDFGGKSRPNPRVGVYAGIARCHVRELKKIVDATGAVIVLTSSWKTEWLAYCRGEDSMYGKYLRQKLRQEGLTIFDTTAAFEPTPRERGAGIINWCRYIRRSHKRNVVSWIAIDDEEFPDFNLITGHLILTSDYTGLTSELATKAIDKLLHPERLVVDL
jgi:hypothetical protein